MKTKDNVEGAIAKIQKFYDQGLKFLEKYPGSAWEHRTEMNDDAKEARINRDIMKKAMRFADKETGYSKKDLRQLYKLYRKNYVKPKKKSVSDSSHIVIEKKLAFGYSHIVRLLSVRGKKRRAELQEKVIVNGLSCKELDEEILLLNKRRRRMGGRPPRVPTGKNEFLAHIEFMCEKWLRWYVALCPTNSSLFADLPEPVKVQLRAVSQGLELLQDRVSRELNYERDDRQKARAESMAKDA